MSDPFNDAVAERHNKVSEIIARHLKALHDEILGYDHDSMNIDNAGDRAEIVRQVVDELVKQLRGFAAGARRDKVERDDLLGLNDE